MRRGPERDVSLDRTGASSTHVPGLTNSISASHGFDDAMNELNTGIGVNMVREKSKSSGGALSAPHTEPPENLASACRNPAVAQYSCDLRPNKPKKDSVCLRARRVGTW